MKLALSFVFLALVLCNAAVFPGKGIKLFQENDYEYDDSGVKLNITSKNFFSNLRLSDSKSGKCFYLSIWNFRKFRKVYCFY